LYLGYILEILVHHFEFFLYRVLKLSHCQTCDMWI
jgi:hypothetical protein